MARQHCGRLGKVANCQVVVTGEYVVGEPSFSQPLHWPVTGRLYLPKVWAEAAALREKGHVPQDVVFQTKPGIALGILDLARAWGLPFKHVVADAGYGDNLLFLEGLKERGCLYVWGVEGSFGLRLPQEVMAAAQALCPAAPG